jgi:hypothetical protein
LESTKAALASATEALVAAVVAAVVALGPFLSHPE